MIKKLTKQLAKQGTQHNPIKSMADIPDKPPSFLDR